LIILSDHGEAFWEHDAWEHGNTLYDELLRVPLVIRPPGGRRAQGGRLARTARAANPVSTIDLYPTILDLARAPPAGRASGVSFLPILEGGRAPRGLRSRVRMSENAHTACVYGGAVRDARYKLVYAPPDSVREDIEVPVGRGAHTALYDLR